MRRRDAKRKKKSGSSRAPIVRFTGAMKEPVRREPICPDKPAKSLAAELASSSDSSSSSQDGSSPDEVIKVDLKADKSKLCKEPSRVDK